MSLAAISRFDFLTARHFTRAMLCQQTGGPTRKEITMDRNPRSAKISEKPGSFGSDRRLPLMHNLLSGAQVWILHKTTFSSDYTLPLSPSHRLGVSHHAFMREPSGFRSSPTKATSHALQQLYGSAVRLSSPSRIQSAEPTPNTKAKPIA
jgi:hypothetical protein